MIDRQVCGVSYGHLGEAVYDEADGNWTFTRNNVPLTGIQPVHPLIRCIPPSIQTETLWKNLGDVRTNIKCLAENFPETGPAWETLSFQTRNTNIADSEIPSQNGALVAFGKAADIDQTSGSRTVPILAMAYGQSGEYLRLIKPRTENRSWEEDGQVKLQTLNAGLSEDGYWFDGGGPICQTAFASDIEGLTSWLAVRKSDSTSILRPVYHPTIQPHNRRHDFSHNFPQSRLHPNHILTVTSEETGGSPHSDVSFNPWYTRQFALVDQQGHWTIWNVESHARKRKHLHAVIGLSGNVRDELVQDSVLKVNSNFDGWCRVLWGGDVSTLIVCDRLHLTVFSLKSRPQRLPSPDLISPNSSAWILDVKRHPKKLDNIFVLTTTHIFWLQIIAAGEDDEEDFGEVGAKVLLSCRHFRGSNNATLNIDLLIESEEVCTLLLYSSRNLLVNTYRFTTKFENDFQYSCSFDALFISRNSGQEDSMKSMCITPALFVPTTRESGTGPGSLYIARGVQFYQVFEISASLALSHTLLATNCATSDEQLAKNGKIICPTISSSRGLNVLSSSRVIDDDFVVRDELDAAEESIRPMATASVMQPHNKHVSADEPSVSLNSKWIDARPVYKYFFPDVVTDEVKSSLSPDTVNLMTQYIKNITNQVKTMVQDEVQGTITLAECAGFSSFDSDIDEAAVLLTELIQSLNQDLDQLPFQVVVSGRRFYNTGEGQSEAPSKSFPDLSKVYDELVGIWVNSLPRKTPGPTRLAREKLVRNIAAELYLNAKTVTVHDASVSLTRETEPALLSGFVLPVRGKLKPPQNDSQMPGPAIEKKFSKNSHENFPQSVPGAANSLPIPAQAPSSPSHEDKRTSEDPVEDSAVARLRAYVVGINSQPPLSKIKSSILSEWPSSPGADLSDYRWNNSRRHADTTDVESEEQDVSQRRKEKLLRRQRTEGFLTGEKERKLSTVAVSQPTHNLWTASQPGFTRDVLSSQPVLDEIPMTQPDKGLHGSRKMQKPFQRRTKGF